MERTGINSVPVMVNISDGSLHGNPVNEITRTIGQLPGLFADEATRAALPPDQLAYRVQTYCPVPEGEPGGLFFGVTYLASGRISDEYFMTKGHLHSRGEAAEFYWCLQGEGLLLLMDPQRRCYAQRMMRGSLHYVPGHTAHRVVNTGDTTLGFGACWPSDAGHDYETIAAVGFSARVLCIDGRPRLVEVES